MSKQGQHLPDHELIRLCLGNHASAQSELYKRFARTVMGIAMRYSRNREDAQDITQDTFVRIFVGLKNFKSEGSFEGWIKRITVNTAITHYQKHLKFTKDTDLENAGDLSYDDRVLENLSAAEMITLVQALPDGFRTVFNLFAIEGYSHDEISGMLGIATGTSKSQLSRARQHLAETITRKNKLQ